MGKKVLHGLHVTVFPIVHEGSFNVLQVKKDDIGRDCVSLSLGPHFPDEMLFITDHRERVVRAATKVNAGLQIRSNDRVKDFIETFQGRAWLLVSETSIKGTVTYSLDLYDEPADRRDDYDNIYQLTIVNVLDTLTLATEFEFTCPLWRWITEEPVLEGRMLIGSQIWAAFLTNRFKPGSNQRDYMVRMNTYSVVPDGEVQVTRMKINLGESQSERRDIKRTG